MDVAQQQHRIGASRRDAGGFWLRGGDETKLAGKTKTGLRGATRPGAAPGPGTGVRSPKPHVPRQPIAPAAQARPGLILVGPSRDSSKSVA